VAIAGNGLAGLGGLLAWRLPRVRGRWVWLATAAAEVALLLQVGTGAVLVSGDRFAADRLHMFYGFVGFISVALAYSYRSAMRGRLEMFYGLVGLFLMGVGIRALEVR
jgi:hypothetical protein